MLPDKELTALRRQAVVIENLNKELKDALREIADLKIALRFANADITEALVHVSDDGVRARLENRIHIINGLLGGHHV